MTSRKPIQIPSDFALCEDGTIWRWVPCSGGMMEPFIHSHWIRVDDIPSDEEYEKQCKEREKLWDKYYDEMTKRG